MMNRKRMTWAASRRASAAPATPGYGVEDQDHPAHQADPAYEAYKQGDPNAWAETPKPPPYPQGNPPATPGYDVEDQDHPAHKPELPRVPIMKPASLRRAVEKKAAKCVRIAKEMLGCDAPEAAIEDQALDLMDLPDGQIDATLKRLGGGFLAEDETAGGYTGPGGKKEIVNVAENVDEILGAAEKVVDEKKSDVDVLKDQLTAMKNEIEELKKGKKAEDQNDPKGKTLAPGAEDAKQVQEEAKATAKDETKKAGIRALLSKFDADKDGFVTKADWRGSRKLFAALDTDKDEILAVEEVVKALFPEDVVGDDLTPEEIALQAELEAGLEDLKDEKKSDDMVPVVAPAAPVVAPMAAKVPVEEKKACPDDDAGIFSMTTDPMGLGDETDMQAENEDDEILAEIFGGRRAAKKDKKDEKDEKKSEDEVDDKAEDKKAKAKKRAEDEAVKDEEKKSEDEKDEDKKASNDKDEDDKKSEDEKEEDKKASDDKDEDDKKSEDEKEEDKKASVRTASQRPQAPKARQGLQRVGSVAKTAGANEVDELSKLWASEPDVSAVFGVKS